MGHSAVVPAAPGARAAQGGRQRARRGRGAGKPVDDSSWQAAAEAGALKEDPAVQCVFPSCSLPAGYHLPGHPLGQISPACSDPTHSAAVASSPLLEILSEIDSYEDLQVVEREGQITALVKATGDAPMTASERPDRRRPILRYGGP